MKRIFGIGLIIALGWLGISIASAQGGDLALWEDVMDSTTGWDAGGMSFSSDSDVATVSVPEYMWGGYLTGYGVVGVAEAGDYMSMRIKNAILFFNGALPSLTVFF